MIGVLDRMPSGQRTIAWAEPCQRARIWTAIRHVGVRHPSESGWPERCSWDPSLSWHIGFARRPHSQCHPLSAADVNPRSPASTQERRAVRATSRRRTEMSHLYHKWVIIRLGLACSPYYTAPPLLYSSLLQSPIAIP